MNTLRKFLLISAVAAAFAGGVSSPVWAQAYQWKDANGRTVISDTPPPRNLSAQKVTGGGSSSQLAPASKSLAEKEMEFRKRQQEKREQSTKQEQENAAKAARAQNCERAQRYLQLLESGRRISSLNKQGETEVLNDEQRQKEMEQARSAVKEDCR